MSARASASDLGAGCGVGAAAVAPALSSPMSGWVDRIAARNAVQLGPTFALAQSSREAASEGVMAPRPSSPKASTICWTSQTLSTMRQR